jgi:hypothetical protein
MGTIQEPWFCVLMNKYNGKAIAAAPSRRARHHAGTPVALRLQVTMKSGSSSWPVPLQRIVEVAPAGCVTTEPRRVDLSLIRSVTQSGLRRTGSVWGR